MPRIPLSCTVRGCGLSLERCDGVLACARGHAFDIARSGYVNLLQPQDRRSPHPGDSQSAVDARAQLDAAGLGRALADAVVARVAAFDLPPGSIVADVGSGTGASLGAVAAALPVIAIGIDLSVPAVAHAARRFPALTWLVANADRRLPLLDASVDVVLSLHARRNPSECARVLKAGGHFVVAVPAADDLVELRAAVQGRGVERDRVAPLLAEHDSLFTLVDRLTIRARHRLDREALLALLGATYRGARSSAEPHVRTLGSAEVTMASEVCVFEPRR